MKNLKKFQQFALNTEEQKNVKGGIYNPLTSSYECVDANGNQVIVPGIGGSSIEERLDGLYKEIDRINRKAGSHNIVGCEVEPIG